MFKNRLGLFGVTLDLLCSGFSLARGVVLQLFVQTYHRLLSAFWHFYNQCLFNSFRQVIWLECESKVSSRRGCSSTRNSTAGDCIQAVCNWLSKGRSSVGEKGWRLNIQIQYILQYVHTTIHTTVHTYYSTEAYTI